MMKSELETLITQAKLDELKLQQQTLQEQYRVIQNAADAAGSQKEKILTLYEGLRKLTFASKAIHAEIEQIEILPFLLDSLSTKTDHSFQFWITHLEKELAIGIARSSINTIFGSLLIEELNAENDAQLDPEAAEMLEKLRNDLLSPKKVDQLDEYLQFVNERPIRAKADFESSSKETLHRSLDWSYVQDILKKIRDNPYRPLSHRSAADQLINNRKLLGEFTDVLTILFAHFDEWKWENVGLIAQNIGQKWRLICHESIANATFIEIVWDRWPTVYGATMPPLSLDKENNRLNFVWTEEGFNSFKLSDTSLKFS